MILLLILAALAIAGVVATVIVTLGDDRGPVPEIWDYDSRRPI